MNARTIAILASVAFLAVVAFIFFATGGPEEVENIQDVAEEAE